MKTEKIAVVRVRGIRNMEPKIKFALGYVRLHRPNHCVLLNGTPHTIGTLKIIKDYVTFGNIDEETLVKLLYKRGEKGGKLLRETMKEEQIKKVAKEIIEANKPLGNYVDVVFRLHPPRKGYKNIKKHYPYGDLGKRDNMNELIKRMI